MTQKRLFACIAAAAVVLSTLAFAGGVVRADSAGSPAQVSPAKAYASHAPIRINNDSEFDSQFPGRVISGLDINGAGQGCCIYIGNCTQAFTVTDCILHGASGYSTTMYFLDCGLYLLRSSNATVTSVTCIGNYHGLYMYYARNCTVSGNDCHSNVQGLFSSSCEGNTISGNYLSQNSNLGIQLVQSTRIKVSGCNCSQNQFGLVGWMATSNEVTGSTFFGNIDDGVFLIDVFSKHNRFWNNTFIGNNNHSVDNGFNFWNTTGTPHGYGNYWSDWSSPDNDSDGIVDLPRHMQSGYNATDYYPLASKPAAPVAEASAASPFIAVTAAALVGLAACARRRHK